MPVGNNSHYVDTGKPEENKAMSASKYQKKIRAANTKKRHYNKWAKKGAKIYRGYNKKEDVEQAADVSIDTDLEVSTRINYIRQPIERQIQKVYAKNPKFKAKANAPILVDAPPVPAPPVPAPPQVNPMTGMPQPQIDPMTGQPVMVPQIDPMTGQQKMEPQVDPETGEVLQIDVTEQTLDVIEQLMGIVFEESNFKAEAKACVREAHHSPGSIMQVGYQYDGDDDRDEIYFRRRSFKNFIIDPDAEVYDGVVRRCGYMGLRWELTKKEAEEIGLDWETMTEEKNLISYGGDCEPKGVVYNIWDKANGVVVWCPECGDKLAKAPTPWPWKIKGFPFHILKLTEDTDEQFSKSLVLQAAPIQTELQIQRQEITDNTTNSRPYTLFNPALIDSDKMDNLTRREKKAMIAITGLGSIPGDPFVRVGDSSLTAEYYAHYERNKSELNEVLATSPNEALQATDTTAKEAEIIASNAGTSTASKMDIQTDFLNNCVKTAIQIMSQTYTTPRVTQVVGRANKKYWVRWTGSDILKDISISVESGSTEREDSNYGKQVALNLLETMKTVPGMDVTKLALEVLKENGKRNPEDYKLEPEQAAPMGTGGNVPPAGGVPGVGPTTGPNIGRSIGNQINPMV